MKRLLGIVAVAFAAALAGCAAPPVYNPPVAAATPAPKPVEKKPVEALPPFVCQNTKHCEAAWSSAQRNINEVVSMRTTMVTDSIIETYNPIKPWQVGGRITKNPNADGTYTIQATFVCGGGESCKERAVLSANVMYLQMKADASGFENPPPQAKAEPVVEAPVKATPTKAAPKPTKQQVRATKDAPAVVK